MPWKPGSRRRRGTCMRSVLGGHRHLAWKLGEMARGLRILRGFDPCPDRWALGWYLRALGELEAAYEQNHLPVLPRRHPPAPGPAAPRGGERATRLGQRSPQFLMGRTTRSCRTDPLGCVIPRAQILLYQGRGGRAWLATEPEQVYEHDRLGGRPGAMPVVSGPRWRAGWTTPRPCSLSLERAAALGAAFRLRGASVPVSPGPVSDRAGGPAISRLRSSHVDEGLHLARSVRAGLYHVELLCVQAELLLDSSKAADAESPAREAVRLASAAECQFQWGAGEAGHLLGRSLVAQNRRAEARSILERVRSLRLRIGDSRLKQTEALLKSTDR